MICCRYLQFAIRRKLSQIVSPFAIIITNLSPALVLIDTQKKVGTYLRSFS